MVNCAAIGCTNRGKNNSEVNFHKIPSKKHESQRKEWYQNIKRDGLLPKDKVFYIYVQITLKKVFQETCR